MSITQFWRYKYFMGLGMGLVNGAMFTCFGFLRPTLFLGSALIIAGELYRLRKEAMQDAR